jgi:hypothetical protein
MSVKMGRISEIEIAIEIRTIEGFWILRMGNRMPF